MVLLKKFIEKYWKVVAFNIVIIVLILFSIDFTINLLLNNPDKIPENYISFFREYYFQYDRKLAHLLPESGRYDSTISYTLRPGIWKQKNREFAVNFEVNSLGLRDNEESLEKPEIILLGDSQAMGWGVNQEDTVANLIERATQRKVLNAAIVSYGTVRELMLLERINLEKLSHLIIQYSKNDYVENRTFVENNNVLPIMSSLEYRQLSDEHINLTSYYLGKHFLGIGRILKKNLIKKESGVHENPYNLEIAVDDFVKVLNAATVDLRPYTIIVWGIGDNRFIQALKNKIHEKNIKTNWERLILLDIHYDKEDFYTLDAHLNTKGHKKVADMIAREL